ncbi:MAG: tetratricopeptide repeat protein, partial [Blastocatellia bacterium]
MLELGKTIEREMTGGQTHMYQIKLTAGQFLRIEVEQRGIDVIVALFGPDDKQIIAVNETDGAQGTETIFVVDEADRTYRLEVRSPEKDAATGRYETKIAELRIATPQDRARWSAKKAAFEGDQFRKKKDAASLRQAIEKYQEALPSWRAAADRKGEAGTLYTLGLVFMSLTERTSALECFNRALPLFREMGDRVGRIGEADSLNVIGIIYGDFGEWRKALNYYNQALTLFRAESHRVGEAGGLNSIASIYWGEGEFEKALEYYNQALTIVRELKNLEAEATILGNISAVYNAMHEYQRAIEYALRSLELAQALMDHEGEGYVLNEIGVIYARLNEFPTALRYYNQALAIRQKIGDRLGEQMTLDNIGTLHYRSRDFEKALDFYGRALALAKLIQDPSGEAYILANLGKVYDELNDQRKALDYFEQALNLSRRLGDRPLEASILSNIGEVYASPGSPGEKQKPLDYYRQALSLSKTIGGDRHTEALTLYRMAQEERGLGNLAVAREQMEKSLAITESLRTRVASQELRASYFSKALEEYGFYMDLLMQQHRIQPDAGHDVAALQANERGRARGLLELLTEAQVDVRQGVATELLSREKRLRLQLNEKAGELLKLKSGKQSKERAALVEKEYDALLTEYQQFEGEIRQKSPGYAAITQPKPLSPAEIQQQVLSADTLLLEYALGKERSYLWAVSVDSIKSYELPKRATIKDAAENLLAVLSVPKRTVELDSKT